MIRGCCLEVPISRKTDRRTVLVRFGEPSVTLQQILYRYGTIQAPTQPKGQVSMDERA